MNVFQAAKQVSCIDAAVKLGLETRGSGERRFTRCVFHEDNTPSLALYPEDRGFYCFGCHRSGDVITLAARVLGVRPVEAAKRICADHGIAYDAWDGKQTAPVGPLPVTAEQLKKRMVAWREARVEAYLEEKRAAERVMDERIEEYVQRGLSPADTWEDEAFSHAMERAALAEERIARIDAMGAEEMFEEMREGV